MGNNAFLTVLTSLYILKVLVFRSNLQKKRLCGKEIISRTPSEKGEISSAQTHRKHFEQNELVVCQTQNKYSEFLST